MTYAILAEDQALLSQRIGQIRQGRALGCAALEVAVGRIIDRNPECSRQASRLVDRLTLARDLAVLEERS